MYLKHGFPSHISVIRTSFICNSNQIYLNVKFMNESNHCIKINMNCYVDKITYQETKIV